MRRADCDSYTSARAEDSQHLGAARPAGRNDLTEYAVDSLLVETVVVSKGKEEKFQGFAFDAQFVRHIIYRNIPKIGLVGNGAERGKLRAVEAYFIVALRKSVFKGFEIGLRRACRIFRFPRTQQSKTRKPLAGRGLISFYDLFFH